AKGIMPFTPIELRYNKPVSWITVDSAFTLKTMNGRPVSGGWLINDAMTADFVPERPLKPDSSYTVQLDQSKITDVWGNTPGDSVISHYFSVISNRELGEISGIMDVDNAPQRQIHLTFKSTNNRRHTFPLSLISPGKFYIRYLPESRYTVDAFIDLNKDGQYSKGKMFPFTFAEPYFRLPDTIAVRKRWETQDINLKIPLYRD
ncbi:MAG: hypothetical protein GF313_14725, partial [Caldithrix sp.]|nr:hypothetical protein [Caldithrix sp.]